MEVADRSGWKEANVAGVISVFLDEVEGIFLSIEFDNADPLVHFLLCGAIGALPFDLFLLSQR